MKFNMIKIANRIKIELKEAKYFKEITDVKGLIM